MTEEEKKEIEIKLAELRKRVRLLDTEIEKLDKQLAPFRFAEERIKAEVLETHGSETAEREIIRDGQKVERTVTRIIYRHDGKAARAPLYEELMALTEIHGPERTKRRNLNDDRKAVSSQAKKLARDLRRWKPPGPQGSLF